MANTTDMVRIMREAAERLTKERRTLVPGRPYDTNTVADAMEYGASVLDFAAQTIEADPQPALLTREQVDRAVRLAEDRNGKPRDWHLFVDFVDDEEATR